MCSGLLNGPDEIIKLDQMLLPYSAHLHLFLAMLAALGQCPLIYRSRLRYRLRQQHASIVIGNKWA